MTISARDVNGRQMRIKLSFKSRWSANWRELFIVFSFDKFEMNEKCCCVANNYKHIIDLVGNADKYFMLP